MPRHKALFALALFGVLISAGSVGSQDPLRARSDAESAADALPIAAPDTINYNGPDPYNVIDGPAYAAPRSIIAPRVEPAQPPLAQPIVQHPAATPQDLSAVAPAAKQFALAMAASVTDASANMAPPATPLSASAVAPAAQAISAALKATGFATAEPPLQAHDGLPSFDVAERRLFATVPDEIEGYFDLFMYVSKSNRGPLAQRMYVFQRDGDGKIIPYADWPVSTGREKIEFHHDRKIRTNTPEGIFSLDPKRFHRRYWSATWDGAPMHYAMFYDLMNNGNQSGLAIHAAIGAQKIRKLGRRDSAGCIRLSPKNAKELFYKIRNTTQGQVPVLAVNERGSTDRWGRVQHDDAGSMLLQDGYRAIVFVENYDGRDEVLGPVIAYTH